MHIEFMSRHVDLLVVFYNSDWDCYIPAFGPWYLFKQSGALHWAIYWRCRWKVRSSCPQCWSCSYHSPCEDLPVHTASSHASSWFTLLSTGSNSLQPATSGLKKMALPQTPRQWHVPTLLQLHLRLMFSRAQTQLNGHWKYSGRSATLRSRSVSVSPKYHLRWWHLAYAERTFLKYFLHPESWAVPYTKDPWEGAHSCQRWRWAQSLLLFWQV